MGIILIPNKIESPIMDKQALKAQIENKKLQDSALEIAKSVVSLVGNSNVNIAAHKLNTAISQNNTFAKLIKRAAEKYKHADPFVDARMMAGKAMLVAIAGSDLSIRPSKEYKLPLPELKTYHQEGDRESKIESEVSKLITFAENDGNHFEIAATCLFGAIRTEHPTIAQSFMAVVRWASHPLSDDVAYSVVANAYTDGIPYI